MWLAVRQCWVLFFGLFLIMLGNGLQGTLIGVGTQRLNYDNVITGVIMSGYFAGLLLGSIGTPALIAKVGHIRVFGALASLASIAILAFPIQEDPITWTLMRVAIGFSFAGLYIVVESWLNDSATNDTRGQMLAIYMIINLIGLSGGQVMLNLYDPQQFHLFTLVSIMISLAVVPVLATAQRMPSFEEPERMSMLDLYKSSPLGIILIFLVGNSMGIFLGLGGPYMLQSGFETTETAYFLAIYSFGGLLLTWPLGKLSDRIDRRIVIIISGLLSALAACFCLYFGMKQQATAILIATLIYGGFALPIYSLCLAHANDMLKPTQMVAASSTLVLIHGAGAVFGSSLGGVIMEYSGAVAFFALLIFFNILMAGVAKWRMMARKISMDDRGQFVAMPARHTALATALNPEAEVPEYYDNEESVESMEPTITEAEIVDTK